MDEDTAQLLANLREVLSPPGVHRERRLRIGLCFIDEIVSGAVEDNLGP